MILFRKGSELFKRVSIFKRLLCREYTQAALFVAPAIRKEEELKRREEEDFQVYYVLAE